MSEVPLPFRLIGQKVWLNTQADVSPLIMIHYDELIAILDQYPPPQGFRIPTEADFDDLLLQVGGDNAALRTIAVDSVGSPTVWRDVYPAPTNASGLSCEPRGWQQYPDEGVRDQGTCAAFWTSTIIEAGASGGATNRIIRFCGYQWFSDLYTSAYIRNIGSISPGGEAYARASVLLVADLADTQWAEGGGGPDPTPPSSLHAPMLSMLKGGPLGLSDHARISVDAEFLDAVMHELNVVHRDLLPDTATDLSRWRSLYQLSADASSVDVLASYSEDLQPIDSIALAQLAAQLGYTVSISGGDILPFRADISRCDIDIVAALNGGINGFPYPEEGFYSEPPGWQTIYPGHAYCPDLWIITVTIIDLGTNSDSQLLRRTFERIKRADTILNWME